MSTPEVLSARDERCARCQGAFDPDHVRAECERCFAGHHGPSLALGCAAPGCGAVGAASGAPPFTGAQGLFRTGFDGVRTVVFTGKSSILLAGLLALLAAVFAVVGLVCVGVPMALAGAVGSLLRAFGHEDQSITPGRNDGEP